MSKTEKSQELATLRRNILVLTITEMISNTGWNMHGVIWQPYVLSLGATVSSLGTLTGAQTMLRAGTLLTTGRISDQIGRKRLMIVASVLSATGISLSILAAHWVLVIPSILLWGFAGAFWEPTFRSMIAESVENAKRGLTFGLMSLTWYLPGFYAPALAGYIAETYNSKTVLAILLVCELTSLAILSVFARDTLRNKRRFSLQSLSTIRQILKPSGDLRRFYLSAILNTLAFSMTMGTFYGMLIKTFSFSLLQLGILSNVFSIVTSLFHIPMGRLADRHGRKRFLLLSTAVQVAASAGFISSRDFTSFLLFNGLSGLAASIWNPAYMAYLSDAAPPEEIGRFFGDLAGLTSLFSFPAPIIGALLYENYGLQAPLTVSFLLYFITLLTLTRIRSR